mmetsp:Transcript_42458/g.112038  ORF Transcript_42458/g.112038 Transcript_42458/m.112038 type:complete len:343 (-) Transcript_42458:442-1470(-)
MACPVPVHQEMPCLIQAPPQTEESLWILGGHVDQFLGHIPMFSGNLCPIVHDSKTFVVEGGQGQARPLGSVQFLTPRPRGQRGFVVLRMTSLEEHGDAATLHGNEEVRPCECVSRRFQTEVAVHDVLPHVASSATLAASLEDSAVPGAVPFETSCQRISHFASGLLGVQKYSDGPWCGCIVRPVAFREWHRIKDGGRVRHGHPQWAAAHALPTQPPRQLHLVAIAAVRREEPLRLRQLALDGCDHDDIHELPRLSGQCGHGLLRPEDVECEGHVHDNDRTGGVSRGVKVSLSDLVPKLIVSLGCPQRLLDMIEVVYVSPGETAHGQLQQLEGRHHHHIHIGG